MEKRVLIRIVLAVGSAATFSSATAPAQTGVTFPSGRLAPSVFNEWTQFFDGGTSVAQARVRLLHSIQGSNRGQVNKWLNQWLRGLLDDKQAEDVFEHGPSTQLLASGGAAWPSTVPTDNHNSVTIGDVGYDLVPPGGSAVTDVPNPNGEPDQPLNLTETPVTANPEPATLLLLAPGFLTVFVVRRRRRHSVGD